jgi:uncharacterized protein YyaL (SSP411 family)
MMAAALSTYLAGPQQVVIVGGDEAEALMRAVKSRYLPFATVLGVREPQQAALAGAWPLVASMKPVDGRAAAYVCRNFTCRPPATTMEELQRELSS